VTYTLGGADSALFSVDAGTGVVSMIARNYEAAADAGANNVYNYTLTATDADGNTDGQEVVVTVTDATEVSEIVITNLGDSSVAENVAYTSATPALTGTPIGAVTYTLGGADSALFSVDAGTGVVSMIARTYEAAADAGANNVYNYTLTATDADGNTDGQEVVVTVTAVNDNTPSITSAATANFAENATGTVYTATGTDADAGSTLSYSLDGADKALFAINTETGVVTFVSSPNFEVPTDAGADNVYNITVSASDGTNTSIARAVAITVTDVDEVAPTLSSSTPADNAPGVSIDSDIVLTFSETVQAGTGNIVISNDAGDTRTIAVGDMTQVTITGTTVTINPTGDLNTGTTYSVQMGLGVFEDLSNNDYAGIFNDTTLNFTVL
jgi:methionine-rich copper-binding protein CopC